MTFLNEIKTTRWKLSFYDTFVLKTPLDTNAKKSKKRNSNVHEIIERQEFIMDVPEIPFACVYGEAIKEVLCRGAPCDRDTFKMLKPRLDALMERIKERGLEYRDLHKSNVIYHKESDSFMLVDFESLRRIGED